MALTPIRLLKQTILHDMRPSIDIHLINPMFKTFIFHIKLYAWALDCDIQPQVSRAWPRWQRVRLRPSWPARCPATACCCRMQGTAVPSTPCTDCITADVKGALALRVRKALTNLHRRIVRSGRSRVKARYRKLTSQFVFVPKPEHCFAE